MPAIKAVDVAERRGSNYPSPFDEPCRGRLDRSLGDRFGLKDFGVHLVVLEPGAWSSQRHWHTEEDELVYVLEGAPTLITNDGPQVLQPGHVVGFRGGVDDGHHFVNDTDSPVQLLVVGSRKPDEDVFYSDIDMQILGTGDGARYTRRNGEPYY